MPDARPRTDAPRFLIVDDDQGDRGRIKRALSRGFPKGEFVEVADPQAWDSALAQGDFDAVLTEYRLRWSDGLQVLKAMRRLFPHHPVIWVSQLVDEKPLVAGKKAGLTAYVAKPHLEALVETLHAALSCARLTAKREPALAPPAVADDRYRILFELTADYAYALHVTEAGDLVYEWVSESFTSLTGYTLDMLIQAGHWPCPIHPHDQLLAEQRRQRWLLGESDRCEWRIRTRSGQELWLHDRARPVWDADRSRVVRVYGAGQDITQRKRDEELAYQAQKMEAIGRLAGGIAHDFNNLLQVITGYSDMLLRRFNRQKPLRQYMHYAQEIRNVAEQGAILTRQLMAISRRQPLQPQLVELRRLIGDITPMLRRLLGEDIELVTVLDPALGRVNADPGQLEQVILNLAVNARDAMPHGGRLLIEAVNVESDRASSKPLEAMAPGPYIQLLVQDTGCGMDAEVQAHIFEPFFTTKEPGKGTGLGLYTAHGIVTQNGGHMTVDSAPGAGTTFTIYLPRVDDLAVEAKADAPPRMAAQGGETILLVEDEAVVRDLVRQILQGAGYTVVEAATGEEALQIGDRHTGPLHAVLADVVLPGMSGPELAKQLAQLRPHVPVLYMSGYAQDTIVRHGGVEEPSPYLQKPFTPDALLHLVRETLDAASSP
jgi:PAS domain S-box-containing protein